MSTQSFETQYASERLIMNNSSWTISDYNQFFYNIEIGMIVIVIVIIMMIMVV